MFGRLKLKHYLCKTIKNKNKMETPKQIIVSSEDTDVWALAQILNDEQVAALLSSLLIQGKIKDYER